MSSHIRVPFAGTWLDIQVLSVENGRVQCLVSNGPDQLYAVFDANLLLSWRLAA